MRNGRGMSVAWLWLAPLLMILVVVLAQWLPLLTSHSALVGSEVDSTPDNAAEAGPDPLFEVRLRPFSPLELRGRDIYLREGCSGCHSQMVRLLDSDRRRYGSASQPADFAFEQPVQWGLRRYGPDLSRIGGKYPSAWHRRHLLTPRQVVVESNMPAYRWLAQRRLSYADLPDRLRALRRVGQPYSLTDEEQAANRERFGEVLAARLDIHRAEENLLRQASQQDADGDAAVLSELDALIAYLQVMGVAPEVTEGN